MNPAPTAGGAVIADDEAEAPRRDFVQSLERGMSVLSVFDEDHPQLTLSDVAPADRSRSCRDPPFPLHLRCPRLHAPGRSAILPAPETARTRLRLSLRTAAAPAGRAAPSRAVRGGARIRLPVDPRRRPQCLRRARAGAAHLDGDHHRGHQAAGAGDRVRQDFAGGAGRCSGARFHCPQPAAAHHPLHPAGARRADGGDHVHPPPGLRLCRPGARKRSSRTGCTGSRRPRRDGRLGERIDPRRQQHRGDGEARYPAAGAAGRPGPSSSTCSR